MLLNLIAVCSLLIAGGVFAADGTAAGLWKLPVFFAAAYAALFVLAVLFLLIVCAFVRMDKPQEKDSPFYRSVMFLYGRAAQTILRTRIHKTGFEKLPKEGRYLLLCNHLHLLDPFVLHLAATKKAQLAFVSKKENDSLFVINKLMHKTLCQPIDRENNRAALGTINTCIDILKEDKASIALFPEGYTSRDGHLHEFRSGCLKIAQRANVPIVVCTVQNTQNIVKNALHLRHTDVQVDLLEVIPPEEVTAVNTIVLGKRIHRVMAEHLGEPVDPA